MYISKRISAGFTLIELMVSLTVFAIVMVISTSTLLIMINANAKAQALYSATSNLSFALDSMTREIRTGFHYYCTDATKNNIATDGTRGDCGTPPGHYIALTREHDDVRMAYRLDGGKIQQNIGPGWEDVTADDVVIDIFNLTVANTSVEDPDGDIKQPTVDLFIKGHVNNGLDVDTDFNIQTHIVQRRLDLL